MLKGPLDTYMNYTCCVGIKYELGFFKHFHQEHRILYFIAEIL